MLRILLIGFGYHANRIYVPILDKEGDELGARIVASLDLETKQELIEEQKLKFKNKPSSYYIPPNLYDDEGNLFNFLDKILSIEYINAVIISTEPLKHFKYAKWALSRNLHILMDKPISTNINVANDVSSK